MTHENKQLLFRDLCARLPYGVIVSPIDCGKAKLIGFKDDHPILFDLVSQKEYDKPWEIEYIKPYLRPMSSMTEEEAVEYCDLQDKFLLSSQYSVTDGYALFDWLNKKMFDFRGLIPKGLAISIEEFNPYKLK